MNGRTWLLSAGLLGSLAALSLPTMAGPHHAFAAEFDSDAPVELTGTVTKAPMPASTSTSRMKTGTS